MKTILRGMACLLAVASAVAGCGAPEAGNEAIDEGIESVSSELVVSDLKLVNGWTTVPGPLPYPHNGPSVPGVTLNGGVVQLRGGMAGGTASLAFTLPSAYRPTATVYLPITLCNAAKGRLVIYSTGEAYVYSEIASGNASCRTSLEGLSYPKTTVGMTSLQLVNGWKTTAFNTRAPAIAYYGGSSRLVRLAGAMATTGTNMSPFTIPAGMRPSSDVYLPVDMCNATKGRLRITPAGAVSVYAEGGVVSNAQCFTSLEGVTYTTTTAGSSYTCYDSISGWTMGPYSTRGFCLIDDGGIMHLTGAVSTTGTSTFLTSFPTLNRPTHDMWVEVDMCNGEQGMIRIDQFGTMVVEAEHGFSQAACFTSLEGVSFVK
jgi:hypothetical protein